MENTIIPYGRKDINQTSTDEIIRQIENACFNHGLENGLADLSDARTGVFDNILADVGTGFIKRLDILRRADGYKNAYDTNKLNILLKLYIYLCFEYDKCITLIGYYSLCGIGIHYLYDMSGLNNSELNAFSSYARKTLDDADNIRMQRRASDSKQALLNMAYANYRHNWNGQIKQNEIRTTVKTLDDIKRERLETSANSEQNEPFSLE